ncbi:MAG: arylsulfatase [Cyclobacteriaceae bacterium]
MKIRARYFFILLGACALLTSCNDEKPRPNIVYILADDLGYGDLGSYGQKTILTPNLDRLAKQGISFTQHYSGSAVCAPSRSALLTGLHTGHTPIRGNREVGAEGQVPLPAHSLTMAKVMQQAGYKTGAFGKWGLGFVGTEGDPLNQGFDVFFGYNCQRLAHRYYPLHLWSNDKKVMLAGNDWIQKKTYAPDVIQSATLKFFEENKDAPFFAYVPLVLPHAELISPQDSILALYDGEFDEIPHSESNPYTSDYGANIKTEMYCPQDQPKAVYASMVTRMDAYVGQILDKLEELNLSENTLVIFTSDNGPHTEGGYKPEYFDSNGIYRGMKRDLYEGGIRVPMIARWPGKIKANSNSAHASVFYDMMPTISDLIGLENIPQTDGISFLPTLLGHSDAQVKHDYLYWELNTKGGRKAVRFGNWKAVHYQFEKDPESAVELYDLSIDPSEQNDLADQFPEIVAKATTLMNQAHKPSELFPWQSDNIKR